MRITSPTHPDHERAAKAAKVVTIDTLAALELFAGLPDEELDHLCHLFTLETAAPGAVLEAQDAPVRHWRLLVSGHAVVERDGTSIGLVRAGDSWSEHSMLNGMRAPISVVALSPVTFISVNQEQFFALPDDHPLLAGRLVARSASSADRMALPVLNALIHMAQAHPPTA